MPLRTAPSRLLVALAILGALGGEAAAQAPAADSAAADTAVHSRDPSARPEVAFELGPVATDSSLVMVGLENVTALDQGFAYENRRWRHALTAAGEVARLGSLRPGAWIERRLGIDVAMLLPGSDGVPARVLYPIDDGFPFTLGRRLAPTTGKLDLVVRPVFSYALGRLSDALLTRVEIGAELRTQPWCGARVRVGALFPVHNEFDFDPFHPDLDRVRPAPVTLEQYAWWRPLGLFSGAAGIFGGNRYGASVGVSRPIVDGTVLLDAQADLTGYVAFTDTGMVGSSPERWTGSAAATWRPRAIDAALRVRGGRFLFGDDGVEVELSRTFHELEIAFFAQRSAGITSKGLRAVFALPPERRPTRGWFRVMPSERFSLSYRDEGVPIAERVRDTGSRDELLRELHPASLAARRPWFESARAGTPVPRPSPSGTGGDVSLVGMTGFVTTPWAGVMEEGGVELGYNRLSRGASWDHRGEHRNDVYYAALGFLPRIETGLRWTVIPGLLAFPEEDTEGTLTDADRMVSARVALLVPGARRPGLAIGIEDAFGTQRFHSTYVVTGMPFGAGRWRGRGALGYAPRLFEADRHVLDGAFGALEATAWRHVTATVENDGARWNVALRLAAPFGIRARAAWLDLEHAAIGIGWLRAL